MLNQANYSIRQLNENAVVLYFGDLISDINTDQITALHAAISLTPFDGYRGSVPAYLSLTIYFDLQTVLSNPELSGETSIDKITAYLVEIGKNVLKNPAAKDILVPMCYSEKYGPDLEAVAKNNRLTTEEIIHLHHSKPYKVAMLGFMPGFPYFSGLHPSLTTKRKTSPVRVPAGSLGIAGQQTGIYPVDAPGGWNIIGRTPIVLFDFNDNEPAYFKPGTTVRFSLITNDEYEALSN